MSTEVLDMLGYARPRTCRKASRHHSSLCYGHGSAFRVQVLSAIEGGSGGSVCRGKDGSDHV